MFASIIVFFIQGAVTVRKRTLFKEENIVRFHRRLVKLKVESDSKSQVCLGEYLDAQGTDIGK